ncbi:MAG: gamma-glutamyl-gamma-aminobutyrate hydrolase family protein [Clostridia bacterium]|nr:gamma-glutamyl-gamma-aminobutyrate hydrolase family protein [Clostridia bacterium]
MPKILLSATKGGESNYFNAVLAAGGEPALAQEAESYDSFDGLILCGGGDVDPSLYGQSLNGTEESSIKPWRDKLEFELLDLFTASKKPVLGICRGHQVINVYFKGTLIQHLPQAPLHMHNLETGRDNFHLTTALKGSFIEQLYGEKPLTNTAHHQAVDRLGEGLEIVQRADFDRTVEGFRHTSLPIYSVQWHPERLTGRFFNPERADGAKLFDFFMKLCK